MSNIFNHQLFGFDRALRLIDEIASQASKLPGYPPYNVRKINDNEFMIEVSVAGFSKDEVEITLENGYLSVSGEKKNKPSEYEYLYKGISSRTFIRNYAIAETIEVKNASIMDGILYILLENIIPEDKKPRKISISEVSPLKEETIDKAGLELAEQTAEKL